MGSNQFTNMISEPYSIHIQSEQMNTQQINSPQQIGEMDDQNETVVDHGGHSEFYSPGPDHAEFEDKQNDEMILFVEYKYCTVCHLE
jgi:hypothetical protein